ncbi:MAG TPA: DNA translocase FtsK 4TM domain-containing protein [Nitrospiria bacterium]|nr:DNA translocase FtsK 4TM domain-containing protein [Nitrospiria bacterium]
MSALIKKEDLIDEIKGIILIASGILLSLAIFSYHPDDPSFFTAGDSRTIDNLIGRVGSYTSDIFFQLFGAGSYLLPIFMVIPGWRKVTRKENSLSLLFLGECILLFSVSSLAGLILDGLPTLYGDVILEGREGGLTGSIVTMLLVSNLAKIGASVILVSSIILSIMLITRTSFVSFLGYFIDKIKATAIKPKTKTQETKEESESKDDLDEPRIIITHKRSTPSSKEDKPRHHERTGDYRLPSPSLLNEPAVIEGKVSKEELLASSKMLEKKLLDFDVEGRVVQVHPGPVVTMYEFEPGPGVKVNRIVNLSDDLALVMRAMGVRIVAPIPGKSVVGIEIPNNMRRDVFLKEIITSGQFGKDGLKIPLALGKDIFGTPVVTDLASMPHLLVAGATGSGKSVALNSMILSLLFHATPDQIKILMIDPKMLELSVYDGIPHLLSPVIVRPRDASRVLQRCVSEMQRRYVLLSETGVRSIDGYNNLIKSGTVKDADGNTRERLPYMVIIIDELADLMMVVSNEIEDSIARLAQMARAAGIHLILATQRPSVDVLTGIIKANFPARISFQVSSKIDSRTILDANGAEQLLGRGDMLFLLPGSGKITRIHGSYVEEGEIKRVVDFVKGEARPEYGNFHIPTEPEDDGGEFQIDNDDGRDQLYRKAVELVLSSGQASASLIQRRLRVGYPRAARMIEMMEEDGIVGPSVGGRPRPIINNRSEEMEG